MTLHRHLCYGGRMKTVLSIAWQSPVRYLFLTVSLSMMWLLRHSLVQAVTGKLGSSPWELLLIPFGLVAVGAGYAALAISLNTTYVESDGQRLRVRHSPCPWPGGRTLTLAQLKELRMATRVTSSDTRQNVRYSLQAEMKDGRKVDLFAVSSKSRAQELLRTLKEKLSQA